MLMSSSNEVELGNIAVGDTLEERLRNWLQKGQGCLGSKAGSEGMSPADTTAPPYGYVVTPSIQLGPATFQRRVYSRMLSGFRCSDVRTR